MYILSRPLPLQCRGGSSCRQRRVVSDWSHLGSGYLNGFTNHSSFSLCSSRYDPVLFVPLSFCIVFTQSFTHTDSRTPALYIHLTLWYFHTSFLFLWLKLIVLVYNKEPFWLAYTCCSCPLIFATGYEPACEKSLSWQGTKSVVLPLNKAVNPLFLGCHWNLRICS